MAEEVVRLSTDEYELIGAALFSLLSECDVLPEGVPLKYQLKEKGTSLVLITFDSKQKNSNVQGGFTGEVSFQVAYKSFPSTNQQRINAQTDLERVMRWFTSLKDYPLLTGTRTITKITVSSSEPYTDSSDTDGNVVFAANAVMEYEAD